MQNILTNKTVSLTELRDPARVLKNAGNSTVAILNRNTVVGYIVPLSAVQQSEFEFADRQEIEKVFKQSKQANQVVLDYLKDK